MKKLLILGGANLHCKLVEAARAEKIATVVADYLPDSPAKAMADRAYLADIRDVNALEEIARLEQVDGVLSTHLDIGQRPYQQLCQRLGVPCFCTAEQVFEMTDKHAFKSLCRAHGVDVVDEYTEEQIRAGAAAYPVFVKPVDSRGSRGQSVCHDMAETLAAIEEAKKESSNGDVLIERYFGNHNTFQVNYFFVNGRAYPLRTADGYKGLVHEKLDRVALCSVSPSAYTEEYMASANEAFIAMMRAVGFENGPVMAQGFYDQGRFLFFDPGIRFPGVEYERLFPELYGVDLMRWMVRFAVDGRFPGDSLPDALYTLRGKHAAVLFPTIRAGKIAEIHGIEEIRADPSVRSATLRHRVGEEVPWTYHVNQRAAEILLLCEDDEALREKIREVQRRLVILDEDGENMAYCPFNCERLKRS